MKKIEIKEVKTIKDKKMFFNCATAIYKGDKNWIRPLDKEIEAIFNPSINERFVDGDAKRWVLIEDGVTTARIAAFYNLNDAKSEKQPTGGCGFFECPNNQKYANLLFDTAKKWLQSKGMQAMDGMISFGDRLAWWGVLVDGFDKPVHGKNYNPKYYNELMEEYGFKNYFNQHSYLRILEKKDCMNPILYSKAQRLLDTGEYSVKQFDVKNVAKMSKDFMEVYNSGWAMFEGVSPIDEEYASRVFKRMKIILDPKIICFAYHKERPIACFMNIPNINQLTEKFNGKLGLIEKMKMLWGLKTRKIDTAIGVIFGICMEYQSKGVDGLILTRTERMLYDNNYRRVEMSWIGDFNPVMMRISENYIRAIRYRRHITYRLLFDPNATFERCPKLFIKKYKK